MIVMSDLEDPFVPLSEGLFVDPYESEYVSLGAKVPFRFLTDANLKLDMLFRLF